MNAENLSREFLWDELRTVLRPPSRPKGDCTVTLSLAGGFHNNSRSPAASSQAHARAKAGVQRGFARTGPGTRPDTLSVRGPWRALAESQKILCGASAATNYGGGGEIHCDTVTAMDLLLVSVTIGIHNNLDLRHRQCSDLQTLHSAYSQVKFTIILQRHTYHITCAMHVCKRCTSAGPHSHQRCPSFTGL
jgi:hypothetical protein